MINQAMNTRWDIRKCSLGCQTRRSFVVFCWRKLYVFLFLVRTYFWFGRVVWGLDIYYECFAFIQKRNAHVGQDQVA